jgi:hypothetical protein
MFWVNALAGAVTGRAPLRLKPSRICKSMGDSVRYAGPHTPSQRPAGAVTGRAPLRLKPSRRWANRGVLRALRHAATPPQRPAGAVDVGTAITLTTTTPGAEIFYTVNGDTPTAASTKYEDSSKPTITANTTIKAIAVKDGMTNSDVLEAAYTVNAPQAVEKTIASNADWEVAIAAIESNKDYVFTINGEVNVEKGLDLSKLVQMPDDTQELRTNITITLKGTGSLVCGENFSGKILFKLGLPMGDGVQHTLIIDGPTLKGGDYNEKLVDMSLGTFLEMKSGAIKDSIYGPAVNVGGGEFKMSSGEIKDNHFVLSNSDRANQSSAVNVSGGTFTMTGGTIKGNTIKGSFDRFRSNGGGAVWIGGGSLIVE